jgi:hypothetical protein
VSRSRHDFRNDESGALLWIDRHTREHRLVAVFFVWPPIVRSGLDGTSRPFALSGVRQLWRVNQFARLLGRTVCECPAGGTFRPLLARTYPRPLRAVAVCAAFPAGRYTLGALARRRKACHAPYEDGGGASNDCSSTCFAKLSYPAATSRIFCCKSAFWKVSALTETSLARARKRLALRACARTFGEGLCAACANPTLAEKRLAGFNSGPPMCLHRRRRTDASR